MLKLVHRLAFAFYAAILFFILAPPAFASGGVHSSPVLALNSKQTWALLIGAFVPLVTYVVNHVGPWVSEPAKAFVVVLASAAAGGAYTALATPDFGWNSATLQMILTSVVATLGAHHFLWKPSGVSTKLGAGSDSSHTHHRLVWSSVSDEPAPPDAKV